MDNELNVITWHEYRHHNGRGPGEVPPKMNKDYLITYQLYNRLYIGVSTFERVRNPHTNNIGFRFYDDIYDSIGIGRVVAWAELPEPYDERKTKMKVHFKNGDDIIYAEQDKRGRREEADVDVYINGVLKMRKRFPKCESKEQLIEIAKRYIGGLNNGKYR